MAYCAFSAYKVYLLSQPPHPLCASASGRGASEEGKEDGKEAGETGGRKQEKEREGGRREGRNEKTTA
eukprot:908858-Rhodomonas_salina.1